MKFKHYYQTFKKGYHLSRHHFFWKLGHLRSLLTRKQVVDQYLSTHLVRKLQLGAGEFQLREWLNSDLFGGEQLLSLNLLKKFPLPDSSFEYIFSEHVHEHFSLQQGIKILKECHRVLKPGGKIRISTPDLIFLTNFYLKPNQKIHKKYLKWHLAEFDQVENIDTSAVVFNNFVREWGHQFIYDFTTLKRSFELIGFHNVTKFKAGKSKNPQLRNLEKHWRSIGKSFNDLETLSVEATK